MSDFVKPLVYNPKTAEEKIEELESKVASLERIIDTQQNTINKYQQVFLLQEAELERLRGNK